MRFFVHSPKRQSGSIPALHWVATISYLKGAIPPGDPSQLKVHANGGLGTGSDQGSRLCTVVKPAVPFFVKMNEDKES